MSNNYINCPTCTALVPKGEQNCQYCGAVIRCIHCSEGKAGKIAYFLAILLLWASMFPILGHAAQTSTTVADQVLVDSNAIEGKTYYTEYSQTANTADEVACIDARGYDVVCYHAATGGTALNVDIDRYWDDTTTYDGTVNSGAVNEDITQAANESGCEAVIAPYYCYDVDTSTAGTLTLTWYLFRNF